MTLIDEIRKESPFKSKKPRKAKKVKVKTPAGYHPYFLHVIERRGFYEMSKKSFNEHGSDCIRETGTLLRLWLVSKGYNYRIIDNNNIHRIYKTK